MYYSTCRTCGVMIDLGASYCGGGKCREKQEFNSMSNLGKPEGDPVTVELTISFFDEARPWREDANADGADIHTSYIGRPPRKVRLCMGRNRALDLLSFAYYGQDDWGNGRSLGTGRSIDDARMARMYQAAYRNLRKQLFPDENTLTVKGGN